MFTTAKKTGWINELGTKLSVFSEEAEGAEPEEKEVKEPAASAGSKKTEMNLDDMSSAQKIALIKSILKHCNDKMEDEDFGDFMEKVSAAVDEYADEAEEDEDEEEKED
jgi:hypothetical protein